MKAIARQYFWWPNLDKDIENFVSNCDVCGKFAKSPRKSVLKKYPEPTRPFERVHIDFLGPFMNKVYFVLIDAYSRWPEVYEMSSTTSQATIEKLREIFSRFGLPEIIISDNGAQLVSEEFNTFCSNNLIEHRTSAPYHPETNGLAEKMVASFKNSLMKILADPENKGIKICNLINRFLASYRNVPHSTTGEAPVKRLLGRDVRTRLSLLVQDKVDKIRENQVKYFKGTRTVDFEEGERVRMRDYKNPAKPVWKTAVVTSKLGGLIYMCKGDQENTEVKRHADQLVKKGEFYMQEAEELVVHKDEISEISNGRKKSITPASCDEESSASFDREVVNVEKESSTEAEPITSVQIPKVKVKKVVEKDPELNIKSRPIRIKKPVNKLNL